MGSEAAPWAYAGSPRIAVITPVYRPSPEHLRMALMSVRQQTIDDWELVVVDDRSDDPAVAEVLNWAAEDPRISVITHAENGGISAATNTGLSRISAPWVALLDHDDLLEPHAFEEVLAAAEDTPDAEVIYSNRDAIDDRNVAMETFVKPDWAPRRLRGNMYIAHLTVLSTSAAREVGGFRSEFDGAQDHDIVLRITERGKPVVHIPKVLYHWRQTAGSTALDPAAKPYAAERGLAAVQAHLDRIGRPGTVRHALSAGFYWVDYHPTAGKVSVVIPTRGGTGQVHGSRRVFAVEAVRSLLATDHPFEVEVVVVHDVDADAGYLDTLRQLAGDRLVVVPFSGPFNFSRKVNEGVRASSGEILVLLNDDVEAISTDWLEQLVAYAQEPDVGAVGAKLFFEDGTIQHAGHCFAHGHIGHISAGHEDSPGEFGSNMLDREVVGVTAAVLAIRREVWDRLAGLDESLPNNFNDVDLCLRLRDKGYRIVQANSARLYHFESRTRKAEVAPWEAQRICSRLGRQLIDPDPYTPLSAAQVNVVHRTVREWVRVSRVVLAEEGLHSFAGKARRRLSRR